jgi:5-methylcytosine-specific restriction enzyme A
MTKPLLESNAVNIALMPASEASMSLTIAENSRSLHQSVKVMIRDFISLSQSKTHSHNNSKSKQQRVISETNNQLNSDLHQTPTVKSTRHIPPSARLAVLHRDGYRCVFCSCSAREAELEVDHIIDYPKGSLGYLNNLQTVCIHCHRQRKK